jgi:hypothetical protein
MSVYIKRNKTNIHGISKHGVSKYEVQDIHTSQSISLTWINYSQYELWDEHSNNNIIGNQTMFSTRYIN